MQAKFLLKLFDNFVAFLIGRSQFFVDLLANILQLGLVGQPHFLDLLQLKFAKQKTQSVSIKPRTTPNEMTSGQLTWSFSLVLRLFMCASRFSFVSSIFWSKVSLVLLTKVDTISCRFWTACEIFSSTSLIDRLACPKSMKQLNNDTQQLKF